LVAQMQGTGAGAYELGTVASTTGGLLTLQANLTSTYTVGGTSKAQVLQVPHYRNLTVQGIFTSHSWDGATGGILAARLSAGANGQGQSGGCPGQGGAAYGSADLHASIFLGSGGGGPEHDGFPLGAGGSGGGIVLLVARTLTVNGTVAANGGLGTTTYNSAG